MDRSASFLGLDVGEQLTLAAGLATPETGWDALPAYWPIRARLDHLRVWAGSGIDRAARVRALLGQLGCRRDTCLLVGLGMAPIAELCAVAAGAGLAGVLWPACRCSLWAEGIMAASGIRELVRAVPPGAAANLEILRGCFAEMMEEAGEYVQTQVLDQDDSLLDAYVDIRSHGEARAVTVPVESLTDLDRLLRPFRSLGGDAAGRHVEFVTARMRCILSTLYPVPRGGHVEPPPGWHVQALANGHFLCAARLPS